MPRLFKIALALAAVGALLPLTTAHAADGLYSDQVQVRGEVTVVCAPALYTSHPLFCAGAGNADVTITGTRYHRCTKNDDPLPCSKYVGRFVTWLNDGPVVADLVADGTHPSHPLRWDI